MTGLYKYGNTSCTPGCYGLRVLQAIIPLHTHSTAQRPARKYQATSKPSALQYLALSPPTMATRGRARSLSPPPRPADPARSHLCICEHICQLKHPGGQWLTRSQKTSHKIVIDLAPAVNQRGRGTGARGPALLPRSQATRGRGVPATTRGRGQTGRGISRPAAQAHYAGVLPSSKRSRTPSPSLNESTSRPRLTISPASKPTALLGDARAPSPQDDMPIDVAPVLDLDVQPPMVSVC